MTADLDEVLEQYHRSLWAFIQGDAEPTMELWSQRDDVTLANPLGPSVRGWDAVRKTAEDAASHYYDGEDFSFEAVSGFATTDLAYQHEIHRCKAKVVGGAGEVVPVILRVTTIFRREDGGWKIVHRHADPIAARRPPESVLQSAQGAAT